MCARQGRKSEAPPHLIKFLLVMRGTLTAAPTRLLPVMKMPLRPPQSHVSGRLPARKARRKGKCSRVAPFAQPLLRAPCARRRACTPAAKRTRRLR